MGKLTLILGGARSGKSTLAERMARDAGGPVTFIATAEAHDGEMSRRISAHKASRPAQWRTIEEPLDLARAVEQSEDGDTVVVDCLTLWVSNHLCLLPASDSGGEEGQPLQILEAELRSQMTRIVEVARDRDVHLLVVSNEVGLGLVPANALGRAYRDILGVVNRWFAAEADQVLMMIAGLPIDLKRLAAEQWR